MYPFEWELPTVPFLWSDPDNPNYNLFPLINNMMSNIIGIHESAYLDMKMTAAEDPDEINRIMVVDLRGAYCNAPDSEEPHEGTGKDCCIQKNSRMHSSQINSFRSSMISESSTALIKSGNSRGHRYTRDV